jgi:hypothetical protein
MTPNHHHHHLQGYITRLFLRVGSTHNLFFDSFYDRRQSKYVKFQSSKMEK